MRWFKVNDNLSVDLDRLVAVGASRGSLKLLLCDGSMCLELTPGDDREAKDAIDGAMAEPKKPKGGVRDWRELYDGVSGTSAYTVQSYAMCPLKTCTYDEGADVEDCPRGVDKGHMKCYWGPLLDVSGYKPVF